MERNIPLVIVAAGRGIRALDKTEYLPKTMLDFNGKYLLDYVFDVAEKMHIKEVFIIVGYRSEIIKEYLGCRHRGIEINYVYQDNPRGIVDAVIKLEPFLNREFVMLLGDEVYIDTEHSELISFYKEANSDGVCGLIRTGDQELIKKNYSVELDENRIKKLVEKPDFVVNNWIGTGTCIFKPDVFRYIEKTPVNLKRGEKCLTDLIQVMIDDGKVFLGFDLKGKYVNVNFVEDLETIGKLLK